MVPAQAIPQSPTLKPLWRDWPEDPWPHVNVLCEGPSILALDPTELLLGPIVAINHALATPTPVDFWATSDHPEKLWKWSLPHQRKGLRYFTTDQNLLVFQELLGESRISACYSSHLTVMDEGNEETGVTILPTILPVLSWLNRLGVMDVRIFGADMAGHGSPLHSSEPYREARDAHSWRWAAERALLAEAFRKFRERGARIERWNPLRSPRRSS